MKNIYKQVEHNMNELAEKQVWWSTCATEQQIQDAKNGKINLPLGIKKCVPDDWLGDVRNKSILCLAGAGGLQAPILVSAGANVTVLDISEKMLDNDIKMAEKYGLNIRVEHGNMEDLSRFADSSFDLIINPVSLCYVPSVLPVFKECYRVLKMGGKLILVAPSPMNYVCDYVKDENGGYYKAVNRMPYSSKDGDWIEFGHTMEDYIGGQIACGFTITGFIEDQFDDITELFFMTRAEKQ